MPNRFIGMIERQRHRGSRQNPGLLTSPQNQVEENARNDDSRQDENDYQRHALTRSGSYLRQGAAYTVRGISDDGDSGSAWGLRQDRRYGGGGESRIDYR